MNPEKEIENKLEVATLHRTVSELPLSNLFDEDNFQNENETLVFVTVNDEKSLVFCNSFEAKYVNLMSEASNLTILVLLSGVRDS